MRIKSAGVLLAAFVIGTTCVSAAKAVEPPATLERVSIDEEAAEGNPDNVNVDTQVGDPADPNDPLKQSIDDVLAFTASIEPGPPVGTDGCSLEEPWDDLRTHMQPGEDRDIVPIESIDDGKLLTAVNEWLRAWSASDVEDLQEFIIPLPSKYRELHPGCIKDELGTLSRYEPRPVSAIVDESNPYHFAVSCEVAIRIAGSCSVTGMGCGDWIKLDDTWRVFPSCGPEIVQ